MAIRSALGTSPLLDTDCNLSCYSTSICPSMVRVNHLKVSYWKFHFRCIAYWTFLLAIGFFGFITGCQVGCTSPMLVKVLGLSCLTPAFGIMTALRGIAAFLGPPAAGFLVDEYLEPGVAFYLCGALMVAACLLDSIASLLNSVMGQRSGYVEFWDKYKNQGSNLSTSLLEYCSQRNILKHSA